MTSPFPNLPLARPDISSLESEYVADVMQTSRLALGPWLKGFEERMAQLCDVPHAIAVNSGTAALHLIVRALGLGPGDEVITTPFSFVASSNCLLFEDVRPRFVDIDPDTYLIDPNVVEHAIGPATRGVLAVDVFGLPADWPSFTELAQQQNLVLIDDACEAPGAHIGGRPVGSWGHAAAFGFYPNKPITTGEGGCITTHDEVLAKACRSMLNQGRGRPDKMEHVQLGYNYRLPELSAAIGSAQIDRFGELSAARSRVASWYQHYLGMLQDELILPQPALNGERSWFVYVIRLANHYTEAARDALRAHLAERNIASAPYFPTIHLQPYYRQRFGFQPGDFPICEAVSSRTLALPFFSSLQEADVSRVADALREVLPLLPRTSTNVAVAST